MQFVLEHQIGIIQAHLQVMRNRFYKEKTEYLKGYVSALENELSTLWYIHAASGFQNSDSTDN